MVRLRGVVGWDRGTVQDSSISKLGIKKDLVYDTG
jgi:hypothetical protein